MTKTFVIDYLPESACQYRAGWAIAVIDVIRATTMAITAVSLGRRCYPVDSLEAALRVARRLNNPILAGELKGNMPSGFDMNNSPSALAERDDIDRPLVMLSSSGTRLMCNARGADAIYLGCFRNARSLGLHLAQGNHNQIALIGAGSRGEFREEDQIGCAWIAGELVRAGYSPADNETAQVVHRWLDAPAEACLKSRSVDYLKRTDQIADLHFILDQVNDLDDVFVFDEQEVMVGEVRAEVPVGVLEAY